MNDKQLLEYSKELAAIASQLEALMLDLEVVGTTEPADPIVQENTDHALEIAGILFNETRRLSDEFYEKHLNSIQSRCLS